MNNKIEIIKQLIGDYPPTFSVDYSPFRNCYAHALNCKYEDRDFSIFTKKVVTCNYYFFSFILFVNFLAFSIFSIEMLIKFIFL